MLCRVAGWTVTLLSDLLGCAGCPRSRFQSQAWAFCSVAHELRVRAWRLDFLSRLLDFALPSATLYGLLQMLPIPVR